MGGGGGGGKIKKKFLFRWDKYIFFLAQTNVNNEKSFVRKTNETKNESQHSSKIFCPPKNKKLIAGGGLLIHNW